MKLLFGLIGILRVFTRHCAGAEGAPPFHSEPPEEQSEKRTEENLSEHHSLRALRASIAELANGGFPKGPLYVS